MKHQPWGKGSAMDKSEAVRGNRTVAEIRRHKILKPDIARLSSYDLNFVQ